MLHNQLPLVQLPNLVGSIVSTAYNFYIGLTVETLSAVVTSAAGVVTLTVEQDGGGNVTMLFDAGPIILVGAKTIALTLGSDISPQINFVYIRKATPAVLTKSTSGFPTTEEFIPIGEFLIPSAARVATYGTFKTHLHTDHIWNDTTEDGHLQEMNEWIRAQPATWSDGTLCTPTLDTGPSPDALTIAVAAGEVLQLHLHDFPAFNSSGGGTTNLTTFFAPNHSTAYTAGKDLYNFRVDSSGNAASNNDRIIWVVWGVVSQDAGDCKVFVNLPGDFYNSDAAAITDGSKFGTYTIPAAYRGSGFLIAKLVYRYLAAGGGQLTLVENIDLTGFFPSHVAGGAGAALTIFPDNVFAIQNVADPTKEIDVDASGITAGNTRTITMADADIDLTPGTGSFATEAEGTLAAAALSRGGGQMTGNITMLSTQTVDGRDLSVDGSKLDGIETNADVTDTANVAAALPVPDSTSLVTFGTNKEMRIDVGAISNSTVRVLTMPDDNIDLTLGIGSFPGKFNVISFGAVGNGSTDDSTAIQAAIDFVEAAGGGTVFLPASTYAIATGLVVNSRGVIIEGGAPAGGFHDLGGEPATTGLKWTGSAGGTILQVTAVSGGGNQSLRACGVKKIKFDANAPTHSNGTVTLDSGGGGSVDGITVNSIQIMSGAEAFDTSLTVTATNVATNINAFTSSPNYYANSSGAVVTISAAIRGTGPNGFVVVSSTTTIVTTDVNLASGVADTSAAIGLDVVSTSYCEYSDLGFLDFTDAGFEMSVVATLGEARDCQHNQIRNIQWEHFREAGACLRLGGDSIANTSFNWFENLSFKHFNGIGLDVGPTDNNTFQLTRIFRAARGAGEAGILRAGSVNALTARHNYFFSIGYVGPFVAEGTPEATVASHDNIFWQLDKDNNAPNPTINTGASLYYHDTRGLFNKFAFTPIAIGSNATTALAARDAIISETARIYNGSSNHTRLVNGAGEEWGINIDNGTGDLRLLRIAGSGKVAVSSINTTDAYFVDGTQVIRNRDTGWTSPTGTQTRTGFATSTVTLEVLAQHVHALIDAFLVHGALGA